METTTPHMPMQTVGLRKNKISRDAFRIELLEYQHYPDIVDMFVQYATEAKQGRNRKLNIGKVLNLAHQYATHPACRGFIAYHGDEPAGMIMASASDFVFDDEDEADASIDIHYVMPGARGTPASRMMLETMLKALKGMGIGDIYTGAESGMGDHNNAAFENVYKKYGFVYAGGKVLILHKGATSWD